MGNIPLTIASDACQLDYSFQPLNQSYFSNQQIPTNPLLSVGHTEPILVPGYAQLVVPSNQLYSAPTNLSSHNIENGTTLTQNSSLHIKLTAYPDPPSPYQYSDSGIASISTSSIELNPQIEH